MTPASDRYLRVAAGRASFAIREDEVSATPAAGSPLRSDPRRPSDGAMPALNDASAEALAGWFPVDGAEVPVLRLDRLLNTAKTGVDSDRVSDSSRILLIDHPVSNDEMSNGRWGLLVESMLEIEVRASRIDDLPAVAAGEHTPRFRGVAKLDEGLLLVLRPSGLSPYRSLEPGSTAGETSRNGAGEDPRPHVPVAGTGSDAVDLGRRTVVLFSVPGAESGLLIGLSQTQVPEIGASLRHIEVPGAPGYVTGIVNWRDRVLPLIDLAARIGLRSEPASTPAHLRRMLVARAAVPTHQSRASYEGKDGGSPEGPNGRGPMGAFVIDPSIRMLDLPAASPATEHHVDVDPRYALGAFDLTGDIVLIPDLTRLLTPDD